MKNKQLQVQGVKVNYYYICKRKLWLFSKGINMENNSDRVLSGKVLHESSYPRIKKKEILLDDLIKLDAIDGEYVREVKISSKMKKSDRMQLLYYLYCLKNKGIEKKGLISYVKEKRVEEIELTEEDMKEIEEILIDINKIVQLSTPPKAINLPYCKKCSYYEFCYVEEVEE
ncbi:MAG: CRISPR-associated protein Cas4 [bacterium]